jgi:hypothetical protein
VTRASPIRDSCFGFFLFAACAAYGQKLPSAELVRGLPSDGPNSAAVHNGEMRTWESSFPDAPSSIQQPIHPPTQELRLHEFVGAIGVSAAVRREAEPYQNAFIQEESSPFLTRHLYPSSLERDARYHASTSDSFMGRTFFAASRVLVTHDSSGKGKLNTRYFLGVLASVAAHSASRANRMQSALAPFNDFGSTVGEDAGMNVFHEFGPGIQQIMKAHTPKFVARARRGLLGSKNVDVK